MYDTIGGRIGAVIDAAGLKKVRFAERLQIDQSYVTQLVSGKRTPSDRIISSICREFAVDENWLRTGRGEMFLTLDEDAEFDYLCTQIQLSDDTFIKGFLRAYWKLPDEKKAVIKELMDSFCEERAESRAN